MAELQSQFSDIFFLLSDSQDKMDSNFKYVLHCLKTTIHFISGPVQYLSWSTFHLIYHSTLLPSPVTFYSALHIIRTCLSAAVSLHYYCAVIVSGGGAQHFLEISVELEMQERLEAIFFSAGVQKRGWRFRTTISIIQSFRSSCSWKF